MSRSPTELTKRRRQKLRKRLRDQGLSEAEAEAAVVAEFGDSHLMPASQDRGKHAHTWRSDEEQEAVIEAERAARAKARRLFAPRPGNPDPGLLAQPWEPWGSLLPLDPGAYRRRAHPGAEGVNRAA